MPYIKDELFSQFKDLVFKILADSTKKQDHSPFEVIYDADLAIEKTPHIDKLIKYETENATFLKFTEQEILRMPKKFRKEFRVDGCTARITTKPSGKDGICYIIRYRRNGYNVEASSTNLQKAKDKFIEKLKVAEPNDKKEKQIPKLFNEFAMFYFETYRKHKVVDFSYKKTLSTYNKYIKDYFDSIKLNDITPTLCKTLFDKLLEKGLSRTCEDVRTILNLVLEMAKTYNLIHINPIKVIPYTKHERTTGKAISRENEKLLISSLKNSEHLLPIVLMLYAGLRPGEIYSARIEGNFIIAKNIKRKNRKIEYKKIAISAMLKPYLPKNIDTSSFIQSAGLGKQLHKVLPEHALKDCRKTFSTRCQECGVDRLVVKLFMGHTLSDVLGKHYTDFSDEYLLKEIEKVKY